MTNILLENEYNNLFTLNTDEMVDWDSLDVEKNFLETFE